MMAISTLVRSPKVNVTRWTIFSLLLMVGFLGGKCAFATTYYINNTVTCTDSNAGTSTGAPWCGFTKVNGVTFSPGDNILLYYAGTWTISTTITPGGSGVSGNPITMGCYPATSCATSGWPTISLSDNTKHDIDLENPSYWTIS